MKEIEGTMRGNLEKPNPLYQLDSCFPMIDGKKFSQIIEMKSKIESPRMLHIANDYSQELEINDYVHTLRNINPDFLYVKYNGKMPKTEKPSHFDVAFQIDSFRDDDSFEKIYSGYKLLKKNGYLHTNRSLIYLGEMESFFKYLEQSKNGFGLKFSEQHQFLNPELTKRGFCFMDFAIHKEEKHDVLPRYFTKMLQASKLRYKNGL